MKKKRDVRRKEIILDFLNTKFDGCELKIQENEYNVSYKRYYLGRTLMMATWKYSKEHKGTFDKDFLKEFAIWFPNFKYKRRILKEWFITNYNIDVPEGCRIYAP
jgi:hypothetical protein